MRRFAITYTVFIAILAVLIIVSYQHDALLGKNMHRERNIAQQHAQMIVLNLQMPHDYTALIDGMTTPLVTSCQHEESYFNLITQYMPQNADAYALLGYCYAKDNHFTEAAQMLEKSLMLNPAFFWTYYNLGLVFLHTGKIQQAYVVLNKALDLAPGDTLTAITSSKIYIDILRLNKSQPLNIADRLRLGYQQATGILSAIEHHDAAALAACHWQFI